MGLRQDVPAQCLRKFTPVFQKFCNNELYERVYIILILEFTFKQFACQESII